MRLPVAFFDVNPTGRLLSRFSKDIDDIDGRLPRCLDSLVFFTIEVICITINNFLCSQAVTTYKCMYHPLILISIKTYSHENQNHQTQLFTAY